jgi:predicted aspartyl protease
MITGEVNALGEPTLVIRVHGRSEVIVMLRAGVDTGFTQHLCLPYETILALNLAYRYPMEMELGDGSIAPMGVYDGWIEWEGDFRRIPVHASDGDPQIGLSLVRGCRLCMDLVDGGRVTLEPL